MAKVESPRFNYLGYIWCDDCPFTDEDGVLVDGAVGELCRTEGCAKASTYAEACDLATKAEKEPHP